MAVDWAGGIGVSRQEERERKKRMVDADRAAAEPIGGEDGEMGVEVEGADAAEKSDASARGSAERHENREILSITAGTAKHV